MFLRAQESALASVTGGNGAIYAVRREAYVEVDPIMGHDLSFPFRMVKNGWRAVYQPAARATEKMVPSIEGEWARKRRMMSHGWPIVIKGGLADPRGYSPLYALMIVSHRLLRYGTPFLHVLTALATLALLRRGGVYKAAAASYTFHRFSLLANWVERKAAPGRSVVVDCRRQSLPPARIRHTQSTMPARSPLRTRTSASESDSFTNFASFSRARALRPLLCRSVTGSLDEHQASVNDTYDAEEERPAVRRHPEAMPGVPIECQHTADSARGKFRNSIVAPRTRGRRGHRGGFPRTCLESHDSSRCHRGYGEVAQQPDCGRRSLPHRRRRACGTSLAGNVASRA